MNVFLFTTCIILKITTNNIFYNALNSKRIEKFSAATPQQCVKLLENKTQAIA